MKIYIASSWKNQHAVEMLTWFLRRNGHEVASFVENNYGECQEAIKPTTFEEWLTTKGAQQSFDYDTTGATQSDAVVYLGPSGTDAWAEVGAAWASNVPVIGLWAKGEPSGLMRKMVSWVPNFGRLIDYLAEIELGV